MARYIASLIAAATILLSSSHTSAQTITSSGFEDFDMNNSTLSFVAKRFNYYYFLKQDFNDSYVMVFDTTMSRKAVVELDFLPTGTRSFSLLSNRDGFVCMFRTTDRKDSTVIQRVELNDYLRIQKRPQSIDTISEDMTILEWINSPSEKYTLAVCQQEVRRSKNHDELILMLYDQLGQKLKTLAVPIELDLELVSIEVDNEGTLYIAQPSEEATRLSIWTSKLDQEDLNQNYLTSESYLINKIFLHQNPSNNTMYYVTDFMKVGAEGNTRGFGFGSIDHEAKSSYHEVDNKDNTTLSRLFSGGNNYKLRLLNPTSDGGLVVGLEEYDQKSNTVVLNSGLGRGGTYTRVEHEYQLGDIHLMHVDKDGKLIWSNIYRKFQISKGDLDPALSFGVINKGSSITIYFNQLENKNNIILEGKTIYPDGTSKDLFFIWKNAKKDYSFLVSKGAQISNSEAIVPVYSQGKLGLAKIDMY